jgi:hypothetical protein
MSARNWASIHAPTTIHNRIEAPTNLPQRRAKRYALYYPLSPESHLIGLLSPPWRASLPDMDSSTANRTGDADKILPPEAQPVCWEFRHECFLSANSVEWSDP